MLIVVVIIGILSSALLPRLTGYMARTRDLKRKSELRNIAAAIEMYRNDNGEWPLFDKRPYLNVGSISKWESLLKPYLTGIPKDPSKKTIVDVRLEKPHNHRQSRSFYLKDGEYLLQYGAWDYRKTPVPDFALLVAKVETPEAANYLIFNYDATNGGHHIPGNARYYHNGTIRPGFASPQYNTVWDREWKNKKSFVGCDEVRKADNPRIIDQNGKRVCEYSSEDQLYYIVYIE